jgi:MFS transporter, ACS family, tartrate transporter
MAVAGVSSEFERATFDKVAWRLIPFLFLCYIVSFLDRVNVGFAKLQMAPDLQFSDTVYGFGAGVFFIGYFFFEVPSNMILERVGARMWIARIMVTWGIISTLFMFTGDVHWGGVAAALNYTDAEFTFYLLRFLLGVAEAGFFPGIILYLTYWFPGSRRSRVVALFMTAVAMSNVIGSPVSGAIMQFMDGYTGLRGWQWLFLLEGTPSVIMGLLVLVLLPNGPRQARWLTPAEQEFVLRRVQEEEAHKADIGQRHSFAEAFKDGRVWALSVVYFCGLMCLYAVNFWMPTIIQELGIDNDAFLEIGLLSMIPWGVAAVAMVLWGTHSDRVGERRWHAAIGLIVAVAGLVMLAVVGHAPMPSMIALTLVTTGTLCWAATFWSLPTAFLSGTAAAAGIAWINSVGNLGGHFGPDLVGRVRAMSGGANEAAFWTLAAAAVLGIIIILMLPATQRRPVGEVARVYK